MGSVCLFSSDVSSYLGENKWSVIPSFERLLKKLDPERYETALCALDKKRVNLQEQSQVLDIKLEKNEITEEQHIKEQAKVTIEMKKTEERHAKVTKTKETYITEKLGEKSKEIMDSNVSNMIKKRELNKLIDAEVPKDQQDILKQDIQTFVNTVHGTKTEDYTLATYESDNGVVLDKSQKFYKRDIFEVNGVRFKVGGKMDGIDHTKKCVVEIKNRTRGLFYELRDYENTQIMIYMYLLDYPSAKLVEMYKTKRTVKKNCIDIEYNQGYIDSMKVRLESFCKRVMDYLCGANLVEYLLKSDNEKDVLIWGLIDGDTSGEIIGGDESMCLIDSDSDNY